MNNYYLKTCQEVKNNPSQPLGEQRRWEVVQGAGLLGSSVEGWGCQSHPGEKLRWVLPFSQAKVETRREQKDGQCV